MSHRIISFSAVLAGCLALAGCADDSDTGTESDGSSPTAPNDAASSNGGMDGTATGSDAESEPRPNDVSSGDDTTSRGDTGGGTEDVASRDGTTGRDTPTASDTARDIRSNGDTRMGSDPRPSDVAPDGTVGDTSDTHANADAQGSTVRANLTLRAVTFQGAAPFSGASVSHRNQTTQTNAQGRASVRVQQESPFEIRVDKSGYPTHRLIGRAGSNDFQFITLAASTSIAKTIFSQFGGVSLDFQQHGVLVVGVDTPQFQPVVGASVTIGGQQHDQPLTLSGTGGDPDNTIEQGEQGLVAFPNVDPGDVTVSISPGGNKNCSIHPGDAPRPTLDVEAGTVTVVQFICQ